MPTTARNILTASYLDIGVLAAEQPMSSDMGQDGLRRLNNMVSGIQLQSGYVNAIVRNVFPLTAGKSVYTIGVGGDFNVPRPTSQIPAAGLLMQGLDAAVSVTSITRSGYVATVTQTSHGYAVGDQVLIVGANEIDYNGLQQVQTVPTANTWTFTVLGLPLTPATGTITAASLADEPVEITRQVITQGAWAGTSIKTLPNGLFTDVYYTPTAPFGTITLWPVPDQSIHQLVLYLEVVFSGFATLDTEYDWPALPGYAEALQYSFNRRIAPSYKMPLSDELQRLARESVGILKRGNLQLNDLSNDAASLSWNRHGLYNINTDGQGS